MSENRSTQRTKRLLVATLKKLMAQQPLDKIRINTLTDACGINRQTFYYHFRDIYELVEFMYSDETDSFLGSGSYDRLSWNDALLALLRYINKNRSICLSVIQSKAGRQFDDYLYRQIFQWEYRLVAQASQDLHIDDEYKRFLARYHTLTICGLTTYWLRKDPKSLQRPEDVIHWIKLTTEGTMRQALERYALQVTDYSMNYEYA